MLNNLNVQGPKRTNKWHQSEFALIGLTSWVRSLISVVMNNFKCLSTHIYENLNKEDTNVSIDILMPMKLTGRNYLNLWKLIRNFRKS